MEFDKSGLQEKVIGEMLNDSQVISGMLNNYSVSQGYIIKNAKDTGNSHFSILYKLDRSYSDVEVDHYLERDGSVIAYVFSFGETDKTYTKPEPFTSEIPRLTYLGHEDVHKTQPYTGSVQKDEDHADMVSGTGKYR